MAMLHLVGLANANERERISRDIEIYGGTALGAYLKGGAVSAPSPPVSSDVCFQLPDFQPITLDLHLVKPNLCARHMCSPIRHQVVAVQVQLHLMALQSLLIGAEVRHGTCLSRRECAYGKGRCKNQKEHSAHDGLSPERKRAAGL